MVYLYKKIIRKKPYYYLRVSKKKGKKQITKDIAYLGSSIENVKKNLETLPKHKEEIRKAYRKINLFIESNHYLEKVNKLKLKKDNFLTEKIIQIEACKMHFNNEFKKLDELTKKEIFKTFLVEFAHNTTAIEGNTISLKDAKNLLEEGKTPKNKTLREIYDLQNHEKVFFEILDLKKDLDHEIIVMIHFGLMENIDQRRGDYRTRDVKVTKSHFKSSPRPYVKTDMNLLLKWYNGNKNKLHPLVLASIFHHKFEKIHPFMDGNGRTGRMLLNYILIINNYPPLIVHNKTRDEYLNVLRKADKNNLTIVKKDDYLSLIEYISEEMAGYYWDFFL